MKKHLVEFLHRGLLASVGGPVVLAIIYAILGETGSVTSLAPREVALGILTIVLMAFIAGGITMVYQVEQLPLICAILLHSAVLYLDYLLMYLVNGWIPRNPQAIGFFSLIFFGGFALVWLGIYLHIRKKTDSLNQKLNQA